MEDETPDELEIREYKLLFRDYARMAVKYPDAIDSLRDWLKQSAALMISNREETVIHFRKLAEEVDAFLAACQTGEIDPHRFLEETEDVDDSRDSSGGLDA
ncbi:MAG: hypothetical protein V1792_18050 [Pseudomonadota bacterium]